MPRDDDFLARREPNVARLIVFTSNSGTLFMTALQTVPTSRWHRPFSPSHASTLSSFTTCRRREARRASQYHASARERSSCTTSHRRSPIRLRLVIVASTNWLHLVVLLISEAADRRPRRGDPSRIQQTTTSAIS